MVLVSRGFATPLQHLHLPILTATEDGDAAGSTAGAVLNSGYLQGGQTGLFSAFGLRLTLVALLPH